MHRDEKQEAVVLKLNVDLSTLAGERIASVQIDQTFRDMLGTHVIGSAEASLVTLLETQVVVPCRALIRAHIDKLQDEAGFMRLDGAGVEHALIDGRIGAVLLARLEAIAAETKGG